MLLLLASIAVVFGHRNSVPLFAPFGGFSVAHRATGTVQTQIKPNINIPVADGSLTVDPTVPVYFSNSTSFQQWTFGNGSFFMSIQAPGYCFYEPEGTYNKEVGIYSIVGYVGTADWEIGRKKYKKIRMFQGQVPDTASCDGLVGTTLGTDERDGGVVLWDFTQKVPAQRDQTTGACPPATALATIQGHFEFDRIVYGKPNRKYYQLPAECLNPLTLVPYCGAFCVGGPLNG